MKRRTKVLLWAVALLPVLLVGGTWIAGGIMSGSVNHPVGPLPDDLHGRAVSFASESGATIHGWLLPGRAGGGAIALMHGVRDSRTGMLDRARFLVREGYTVLLFDSQAHGESLGEHITFGYLESRDARAAVEFLRANASGERIGVLGSSMGGAAAILATPPLAVDALMIEMVYPTMEDAVSNRLAAHLGGWARILTPLLTWQFAPRLGFSVDSLRPIDRVSQLRVPMLVVAGAEDRYTPDEETQSIAAAAGNRAELWLVPGADHVNLCEAGGAEYERRVLVFFGRHLRPAQ